MLTEYVLHKFLVALDEICTSMTTILDYEYHDHTDELNFCVDALIAMVDEDN